VIETIHGFLITKIRELFQSRFSVDGGCFASARVRYDASAVGSPVCAGT